MQLPKAELEILQALWSRGESTAKQIRQHLKTEKDHATITTLLRRLESKDYVSRRKSDVGREYIYQAIVKPEKTRRALVKNLLKQAFDGSGVEMLTALFQTKAPTIEEIERLEELLIELKANNKKKGK